MARGSFKRGDYAGAANKWKAGYGAAKDNLVKGVANPKRSPTQAAIGAQDRMSANFAEAVSSKRWQTEITRSGDAGWSKGMQDYAATGLANKATKGATHYQAFAQAWGSAVVGAAAALPSRGSFEDNKARSSAMQDWMHQQKGKYRRMWRGA